MNESNQESSEFHRKQEQIPESSPLDAKFSKGFWISLLAYSIVGISSSVLLRGPGWYEWVWLPLVILLGLGFGSLLAFFICVFNKQSSSMALGIAAGTFMGLLVCLLSCGILG